MSLEPSVSVIIPARDAAATIGEQLQALVDQIDAPLFEVIVAANCCSDATADIARSFADRLALRVVVADERMGPGHARNAGAAVARSSLLLFCDADDRVCSGWVAELTRTLTSGGVDLVSGRIEVDRSATGRLAYRLQYEPRDGLCLLSDGAMVSVNGASFGVRAESFRRVGGFDERFGGGAEETDLSRRLLRAGARIAVAPGAVTRYRPRSSIREVRRQTRGYGIGDVLLAAKEGTLPPALPARSVPMMVAREAGHWLVRRRERNPRFVLEQMRRRVATWQEHRAFERGPQDMRGEQPSHFDFVVWPPAAIIGGLAFATSSIAEARWNFANGIERRTLEILDRVLPIGGTFVDVGANVGVFSVAAALRSGSSGRVIAFEPARRARGLLEVNLERHRVSSIVEVRDVAVGAARGEQIFREYENTGLSGFGEAPIAYGPRALVDESPVRVETLSESVAGAVDVLKIDVEGFESDVLRGARDLMERSPGLVVLFEINPMSMAAAGRSLDDLLEQFPGHEWELRLIDERSVSSIDHLPVIDRSRPVTLIPDAPNWYGNIVARRRDEPRTSRVCGS